MSTSTKLQLPKGDPNTDNKKLWRILGKRYDLTQFIHEHPGGADKIMMTQGMEMTNLFVHYHQQTPMVEATLKRFYVDDDPDFEGSSSRTTTSSPCEQKKEQEKSYYQTLIDRLAENGFRPKKMRTTMFTFIRLQILTIASLLLTYYFKYPLLGGCCTAMFALRLVHEGTHGSIRGFYNYPILFEWPAIFYLSPITMWKLEHVMGHHVETNTRKDPDVKYVRGLSKSGLLVKCLVYLLMPWLIWFQNLVKEPVSVLMHNKGYGIKLSHPWWKKKVIYDWALMAMFFYICRPDPWLCAKFFYAFGAWFFIMAQTSHVPLLHAENKFSDDAYFRNQVEESINFGTTSVFWQTVSFALNTQIEHHLFPNTGHEFHARIYPIVKQVCQEKGVAYRETSGIHGLWLMFKRLAFIDTRAEILAMDRKVE